MANPLQFKTLTPGFSLMRATCELGDFRVWFEDDCWFWALNGGDHSYGSEESRDEAIAACNKYYNSIMEKQAKTIRQENDPVKVKFMGEVVNGKIVKVGGYSSTVYQILLDNGKNTCLYFGEEDIIP